MTIQPNKKSLNDPLVSIVIPVLNEQDSLEPLTAAIMNVLDTHALRAELIFVDDGSVDRSSAVLEELFNTYPRRIKVIKLRRRFGKSTALMVGFQHSRGAYVLTMDADLQDDPCEIPKFIQSLQDHEADLVCGWKRIRHDPWHKTIPSKFFNFFVSSMVGLRLHDYNCGFKGFTQTVARNLKLYGEMHRFIPAFAHQLGFRIREIPIKHRPRKYGSSKYGLRRLYRGLFDAMTVFVLTKYLKKPLHFFGGLGFAIGALGFAILLYLCIGWFFGHAIAGRPLFFAGILGVLAGLNLTSIGLIGELIIFHEQDFKPSVLVREVLELADGDDEDGGTP